MHINHRRKNEFKTKAHGRRSYYWMLPYSCVPMRKEFNRKFRRKVRLLLVARKFTRASLLKKVNNIIWNYW